MIVLIQLSQVEYLIDIQVLSSFCVDRKKKQERTANTLPLSFALLTPRHLSWQTCKAVLIMTSSFSFRIGLNLRIELFIRVNSVNSCSSETPKKITALKTKAKKS